MLCYTCCTRTHSGRVEVTKIKTTKINSEGLLQHFTKFSTPENYQPYGIYRRVRVFIIIEISYFKALDAE